ncbi:MAG: hypothetical protein ACKOCM_11615 [Cyanobacteriota bacterium]
MQPLIRGTLMALYLALVLPLPLLAPEGLRLPLALALPLGALLVLAITSEQVRWDGEGLAVGPAPWCRWLLWRRGWQLQWREITAIKAVGTSQGGRVHYLKTTTGQAWLLPQRITGFDGFLVQLSRATGLDTSGIGRLTPPWTYQLLAVLCGLMLVAEAAGLWFRQSGRLMIGGL